LLDDDGCSILVLTMRISGRRAQVEAADHAQARAVAGAEPSRRRARVLRHCHLSQQGNTAKANVVIETLRREWASVRDAGAEPR